MSVNYPENIIVHHTAVSYDKNPNQFDAVNNYHKSKGWGMIGYHYLIEKDGTVKKGRAIGMLGAHCYQQSMNYKSIGICLTGFFDIELPTKEQKKSLKALLLDLMKTYQIPINNIYPHRHFAKYKSCYGSKLSHTWARDLLISKYMYKLVKEKGNPDVYALNEVSNELIKICNEATFKQGVISKMWENVIHEVDSLQNYNLSSEIMLTSSDN